MSFMPTPTREIRPEGSRQSKIAIVGSFTDGFDSNALKPFQGGGGNILEQCLHHAGLIRGECYLTHLFKERVKNEFELAYAKKNTSEWVFTPRGQREVERLREELSATEANVIVACGGAAAAALAGIRKLASLRGYVFESIGLKDVRKVIPTHHPSAAIRGMFTYKHMLACDLQKAKVESKFRELKRPERITVYNFDSAAEVVRWIEYFEDSSELAVDIEVTNFEVSCVSLANRANVAVVVPIGKTVFKPQGWTLEEELVIWRALQRLLGNDDIPKILQNGIFDIQFLLANIGLEVRGEILDTMIGHSCMWPDLPKGLGFLGSIYCGAQEYWKDMVKFDNIKEES
jgi:uracil-DNA glycosylase family 4